MKKIIVLFSILFFISCTNDSSDDTSPVTMTGYKIETSSSPQYRQVTTGNLIDNKLFSITNETFDNGVSQGQTTQQIYFYNADGTVNHYIKGDYITAYLYYDSGDLIGAKIVYDGGGQLNFRFIHYSGSVVYFEVLNLPYDNPTAGAINRIILNFNSNDEVTSAGYDNNFDGIMDNVNTFDYSSDNLTAIHYYDGTNVNYNYSTIIDNFSVLNQNSFGKKNLRILCGESFGRLSPIDNINFSKNILQSVSEQGTYQLLPNNFYELKTEIHEGLTTTTQFFFN